MDLPAAREMHDSEPGLSAQTMKMVRNNITMESGSEVGTHPVHKFEKIIYIFLYRDIFLVWGGLGGDYGCGIDSTHHKHDFSFGFDKKD